MFYMREKNEFKSNDWSTLGQPVRRMDSLRAIAFSNVAIPVIKSVQTI